MADKEATDISNIEPGALVEATEGDLGEEDVSKPRVEEVVKDQDGNVEKLMVKKGKVFQKRVEVPVQRVQAVVAEPGKGVSKNGHGGKNEEGASAKEKVVIAETEAETEALHATGQEK